MTIEYEEISLSPRQAAFNSARFLMNDLHQGLNYLVSVELMNECLKGIGSSLRMIERTHAYDFLKIFKEQAALHPKKEATAP